MADAPMFPHVKGGAIQRALPDDDNQPSAFRQLRQERIGHRLDRAIDKNDVIRAPSRRSPPPAHPAPECIRDAWQ